MGSHCKRLLVGRPLSCRNFDSPALLLGWQNMRRIGAHTFAIYSIYERISFERAHSNQGNIRLPCQCAAAIASTLATHCSVRFHPLGTIAIWELHLFNHFALLSIP